MKTYEEMTQSVMKKAQTHRAYQKRRNSNLALIMVCACCVAVSVVFINYTNREDNREIALNDSSTATLADNSTPRLVLLCATSDKEPPRVMEERVKIPYQTELRIRHITGMTEEEISQVEKEETAYTSKLFGLFTEPRAYSRYVLDNILVTTISIGEFEIKLNDMDKVERFRISTTENGMLLTYPDVKLYEHHVSGYLEGQSLYIETDGDIIVQSRPAGPKSESSQDNTAKEDEQLHIDVDGERLKEMLAEKGLDTLGVFWHISPWAVTQLDKDPKMDLSQFSDRITIRIDYTDGRVEVTTICMEIDSSGKVYAILEGTVINL